MLERFKTNISLYNENLNSDVRIRLDFYRFFNAESAYLQSFGIGLFSECFKFNVKICQAEHDNGKCII